MPKASPRWSAPPRSWRMPAPRWTRPTRSLPDTGAIFAGVWGAALARLVATLPEQLRGLLDPGIHEVARALSGMSAIQYLDAEAMRAAAGHAMARLHQTLRSGAVPDGAGRPAAGRRADDRSGGGAVARSGRRGLSPSTSPASRRSPCRMGLGANGLPRSVQLAAAQYRDDLVLRAARVLEQAEPIPVADLS